MDKKQIIEMEVLKIIIINIVVANDEAHRFCIIIFWKLQISIIQK